MKTFLQNRKRVFFALGLIFFLLCWVLISKLIASDLIFPGPMPVFRKLIELVRTGELFVPLMKTFVKALLGM
ncbi:MAG: ABC transporter permease, partial [Thermotogae bacterium]